jgi:hypothetical protein
MRGREASTAGRERQRGGSYPSTKHQAVQRSGIVERIINLTSDASPSRCPAARESLPSQ